MKRSQLWESTSILLVMHSNHRHHKLGFPTIFCYGEMEFKYGRTRIYEFLRVAEALKKLPLCSSTYDQGTISLTSLEDITRIAEPKTELVWLEFAIQNSPTPLGSVYRPVSKLRRLRVEIGLVKQGGS